MSLILCTCTFCCTDSDLGNLTHSLQIKSNDRLSLMLWLFDTDRQRLILLDGAILHRLLSTSIAVVVMVMMLLFLFLLLLFLLFFLLLLLVLGGLL